MPTARTRPASMTTIRSALVTVDGRCATTMTLVWRAASSMISLRPLSLAASSWEVASSMSSSRGPRGRARAMATRWRSPPEIVRPLRQDSTAAASRRAVSASSAEEALTVRKAPKVRSRREPISPSAARAAWVAVPIRGRITPMTGPTMTIIAAASRNRRPSRAAMATTPPTRSTEPVNRSVMPLVATVRSGVVSAVRRATGSPGLRRSTSATRGRTSRPTRPGARRARRSGRCAPAGRRPGSR
ncbi:hypothetical protein A9R04_17455 [Nocardiopsis dassonvillei]|nr:hypothetical protein A9R04_17455 [Nocardiopsis dassonvillei]